ncbi:MAG: enoyl-CoA hydratase/isomerase family protein [Alphaproteobacteria bacterium]|nr:enoyl-CoA hydratase/isomerase family protein [Alphaproteobacteria bacterium]HRW30292.1 3-hydroxyacyl-CoA dehydrogenase NAD-binding domain-containing protein [Emcibacteraceae bacterium]
MTQKAIKIDIDKDGIALLSIDVEGQSMNVINQAFISELEAHIKTIIGDDKIKGAVICSAKENGFLAGADLNMVLGNLAGRKDATPDEVFEASFTLNRLFRLLETCGKPFAIAINGLTLGGGFELAMSCHYRVVADNDNIKLGLPEVQIGLIPGAGGTQRLPRLMGIQLALPYLLQGKNMTPKQALSNNVIHEIAPADEVVEKAKAWILAGGKAEQPWDQKRFKIPGGQGVYDPNIVQTFMGAPAMTQKETKNNYPATVAILSAVYEGHQLPMDKAIEVESQYFTQQLMGDVAPNMIRTLFVNKNKADKLIRRPKDVPEAKTKKLGMLGAGLMGAGIAYVSAKAGIEVILLDREMKFAEKGKAYSQGIVEKGIKYGKVTQEEADQLMSLIKPTTDYADLEGCDLIIEAVLEDPKVKADVTKKAEEVIPESCIYGSNTSTLPISILAKSSRNEDKFIGIHFFSPVDKMPLVEIILGKKTSELALAKALDYARQIRKTPIVVNDSRGFYTSRCFMTYPLEASNMLSEGISPVLIENSGVYAGMAVGPFAVNDEVGIDLSHHISEATKAALGDKYHAEASHEVIAKLYDLGRYGKKNSKGFYEYPENDKKHIWKGLADYYPLADEQPSQEDVTRRLIYRQALEVVRCLEENVVTEPEDADIGAIFGWGFAPWTGGPISMIDTIGIDKFISECDELSKKHGDVFKVPEMLRKMQKDGQRFYS